jgi:hypothetical protein
MYMDGTACKALDVLRSFYNGEKISNFNFEDEEQFFQMSTNNTGLITDKSGNTCSFREFLECFLLDYDWYVVKEK